MAAWAYAKIYKNSDYPKKFRLPSNRYEEAK